jgi:hypothetical protein
MAGSAGIAAWIAHVAFWFLLVYGWAWGELDRPRVAIFLLLWVGGRVGLASIPYSSAAAMFPSFVAALDIALVFAIFKGDVRLT